MALVQSGERIVRNCLGCNTRFDATVFTDSRGHYVICPRCGKRIKCNSTHKKVVWTRGTSYRSK